MSKTGRRKIKRHIAQDHTRVCFKPCGIRRIQLERVELCHDEMEAIRLSDYEGLYQQEAANHMGISRSTFSRILDTAHKKIADAFLHTKAISITNTKEEIYHEKN
jgi:predicted DNA-binding protein (UPF0251 family)